MTDGGGWGNVVGAVSEAAFMTGMVGAERPGWLGAWCGLALMCACIAACKVCLLPACL